MVLPVSKAYQRVKQRETGCTIHPRSRENVGSWDGLKKKRCMYTASKGSAFNVLLPVDVTTAPFLGNYKQVRLDLGCRVRPHNEKARRHLIGSGKDLGHDRAGSVSQVCTPHCMPSSNHAMWGHGADAVAQGISPYHLATPGRPALGTGSGSGRPDLLLPLVGLLPWAGLAGCDSMQLSDRLDCCHRPARAGSPPANMVHL